jgi:site-specific DNA-cytosine methylase
MKLCIDLCSGLGGFSQAFRERQDWEVVAIDIDPEMPCDIVADVRYLPLRNDIRPRVVLASPPCERFSLANPRWPKKGIGRALEIVGACLEAIVDLKPDYWALENPKGRLRWFLGSPPHSVRLRDYGLKRSVQGGRWRRAIKPTDIWGNIPFPMLEAERVPRIARGGTGFTKISRARRAELPYGLSKTILEAVDL